jgi:predicted AAA+ superfamily ATPase
MTSGRSATDLSLEADPSAFVRHDALLMIDEIQRVPELLLAIKREVDRDPRPGRFLLTGSARLLGLRDLPDALPGRAETIELWPLSQGEIDSAVDGFVDAVFRLDGDVTIPPCSLTKRDYVARALRGGYPQAVRRDPGRRRARFFDSYVTDLVTRDVQQLSDIERPAEMRRLLSVVAARMGAPAVAQSMANDVSLPRRTLSRYLDLLELIFVIKRIPAWSSNLTTRAISTPKLIVTDSGLGGRLIGMSEDRAKDPTAHVGPLLENFAIGEVARQLAWAEEPVDRSPDGSATVRLKPVSAASTPFAADDLIQRYEQAVAASRHHPVLLTGLFVLDLVVICPFEDGNGRVSDSLHSTHTARLAARSECHLGRLRRTCCNRSAWSWVPVNAARLALSLALLLKS